MNDDDCHALDSLLVFLYLGLYDSGRWRAETPFRDADASCLLLVKFHTEVFLLADKYGVPDLKELANVFAKEAAEQLLAIQAQK